jgi:hypothetical protein
MGTLWWMTPDDAHRPIEAWAADLDALEGLGMDLMILNGPFVGEPLEPGADDPIEAFFAEADRRGLRLYLDTLSAPDWWTLDDPSAEIVRATARIADLEARYGDHPSFEGWYIPYELYVFWDKQAELIKTLYREVAAACKRAAPDKPTMISPFFILDDKGVLGDFRWATPDEYQAFWTGVLAQADIDTVALQDSGEHLSCYTFEQRAPFFAAMKAACGATGTALWANVETGELVVSSLDDYTARFGLKTHVNNPKMASYWRGVPADKLEAKLKFVHAYTPNAITWGYREFIRPALGRNAEEVYRGYEEVLKNRRCSDSTGLVNAGRK